MTKPYLIILIDFEIKIRQGTTSKLLNITIANRLKSKKKIYCCSSSFILNDSVNLSSIFFYK